MRQPENINDRIVNFFDRLEDSKLFWALMMLLPLLVYYFTDYPSRIKAYDKANCAVIGYQEDCKTPLNDNNNQQYIKGKPAL